MRLLPLLPPLSLNRAKVRLKEQSSNILVVDQIIRIQYTHARTLFSSYSHSRTRNKIVILLKLQCTFLCYTYIYMCIVVVVW